MRVLIVGCGYVGMALGSELARLGHQVFGVRRSSAARTQLEAAGIVPLTADVSRLVDLEQLPLPFQWVVNCTASNRGGPAEYEQVYLQGTKNLLAWLRSAHPQRYVYTSSTGVYTQNDGSWVSESSPADPVLPTSRLLLETEELLRVAARETGFPAVILRVAGIYGPGRGYWFKQFVAGEARLEGAGERFLNMVHRDDVVGAIRVALERGQPGETYNVTDDEPVRQRDFFGWLAEQLGCPLPPAESFEARSERKRGVTNKRVLNSKLKTDLGYVFRYPTFREGYATEVQTYKSAAAATPRRVW